MTELGGPCYFIDWPAAMLRFTGGDRATFLHNLCTADIKAMKVGEAREAFFTNVKGHVLAHALIYCLNDSLDVLVFQQDASELASHVDRYLIREDVQINAESLRPVLLVGQTNNDPAPRWLRFPLVTGFAWIDPTGEVQPAETLGYAVGDHSQFTAVRVASGWPLADVDFAEGTLPQELSRDAAAISFTKGCYLGQETVARLDALGRVNKQLVRVRRQGAGELTKDMPLIDGEKTVGTLTSVAKLGETYAALAMVRRGSNASGARLQTSAGDVVVEAVAN